MNGDLSMALCLFAWCYFLACPVIVDSFLWAARASENCNKSVRNKNTVTLDTLYMTPGSDGKKGFCLVPDYMVSRPWPCFRSAFYFSHHHSKILRKYFTLQRGLNWPLLWKCHEYSLLDQLLKFYEMKTIIVHEDKCVLKIRFFFQRWRKFKSWEIFGSISNVGSPRLSQPVHSETAGTSWILRKLELNTHVISCKCIYNTVQLICAVQHTETRSAAAWPTRRVSSPSSILPSPSSHWRKENFGAPLRNIVLFCTFF